MNWPSWLLWGFVATIVLTTLMTAGMQLFARTPPRMAGEQQGPTLMRQLEPPGFFAHYGYQTPISVIIAHVVFGVILGAFYTFP